jgi:hypothetical protein
MSDIRQDLLFSFPTAKKNCFPDIQISFLYYKAIVYSRLPCGITLKYIFNYFTVKRKVVSGLSQALPHEGV